MRSLTRNRRGCGFLGVAAAAVVCGAGNASLAQMTPVVLIEHAGLGAWVSDTRDSGMLRALSMLSERVSELPLENDQIPPEAVRMIQLGLRTAHQPARLAIVHNADDPTGGGFNYGMVASVATSNEQDAQTLGSLLGQALERSDMPYEPKPSKANPGMMELATPFAIAHYGVRQAGDRWQFAVMAGATGGVSNLFEDNGGFLHGSLAALPGGAMPAGFKPLLRARIDPAGLEPALQMAEQAVPADEHEARRVIQTVRELGIVSADGPKLDAVWGSTGSHQYGRTVLHGARSIQEHIGVSSTPLTDADLRVVPADATFASVSRSNLETSVAWLGTLVEQQPELASVLDQIREHTSVDVQSDLLEPLGQTTALYTSGTTGAGGAGGLVLVQAVRDMPTFASALERLAAWANNQIQSAQDRGQAAARYLRVQRWEHEGVKLMTVRPRGVPVPLSITIAFGKSWVALGMNPSSAVAAIRQAEGANAQGIASRPDVASVLAERKGAVSLSFMDTQAYAGHGYGMLVLAGEAVANAVRSAHGSPRDPGMVVPPLRSLTERVKPSIQVTRWVGDALVSEAWSDRSMLTSTAATFGVIKEVALPLVAPIMLGASRQRGGMNGWGG